MKLLGFDIETFKEYFCFVGHIYDSETKTVVDKVIISCDSVITRAEMATIEQAFKDADYIISYNGKKFDLPVLAKIRKDLQRLDSLPIKYIYHDAQALISYDKNNNPLIRKHTTVREWHAKHFDVLANCVIRYSLKQWEMYKNLPIRELPYEPDATLTDKQRAEILDYCGYDVDCMMKIFFDEAFDKSSQYRFTSLLAQKELLQWWPQDLPFAFDRTTQAIAAGIIYECMGPVPPATNQPLKYIDFNKFDVPTDVKLIIGYIAKAPSIEYNTTYKGIVYGKGGAHFIRTGHFKNIYAFDFASLYPTIINSYGLLKTESANRIYKEKVHKRLEIKHQRKGNPAMKRLDDALKLFLNAPSGAFRIKSSHSTMFDPAAGEAMCYIGQLLVSELAFACPDFDNLIEINTDSVFVQGDANIEACRKMIGAMKEKHDVILEEEFIPQIYIRDVNNYIMYNEDGNVTGGKGLAYSDVVKKRSNRAVYDILFKSLIKDRVDESWQNYPWTDFIVKYHKSSASKYATIDGQPMTRKNYYFIWTTRDCPNAVPISFSRDLIDRKNGAIKARFGVFAFDIKDLEPAIPYIDYEQYRRDLDVELDLWNRSDLVTTHLTKIQRKPIKSLKDLIEREYI